MRGFPFFTSEPTPENKNWYKEVTDWIKEVTRSREEDIGDFDIIKRGFNAGIADGDKGDITVSGTGSVWDINNNSVSLANIENASANSVLLGAGASGSGSPYSEIKLGTNLSITGDTLNAAGGGGGVTDGDKGDITVSSSGTVWTIDTGLSALKIADGSVSDTEFQYLNGVTSGIQGQIDGIDCFKTVSVSGQSDIVANDSSGTLNIAAGTGITLTTDSKTDTLTITGSSNATTITVADTTDTTAFVSLFESATGDLSPKTDAGLTYNAGTSTLSASNFVGNLTGNASTVTTNANLTGVITSVGNTTSIASQTGTGTKFVVDTSPTLVTPILGVATATSINKVAITAPATGSTLTIADGQTLTVNGSATITNGTHSGTNTGDQTITLEGDVTGTGTGKFTTTIADNSITLAKMEHGTQGDILYYGDSGAPTRLGAGTSGYVLTTKGAGENPVWSASSGNKNNFTAITAPTVNNDITEGYTIGSMWIDTYRSNLTYTCIDNTAGAAKWGYSVILNSDRGDINVTSNGSIWTVAPNAITLTKLQLANGNAKLLGSSETGSGGYYSEINLGTGLSMTGTYLNASAVVSDGDKGDITVSSSGTVWTVDNDAITYAKIQDVSATDKLLGRSTAGSGVVEEIACTAAGRALIDDANAAAQRTTLGLAIGTDVQAYIKNNFTATVAPTVNDDLTQGYSVGSLWVNTSVGYSYICQDNSTGAAKWYYISLINGNHGDIDTSILGGNYTLNPIAIYGKEYRASTIYDMHLTTNMVDGLLNYTYLTDMFDLHNSLSNQYSGGQKAGITTLTSTSASIAIDLDLNNDFTHTTTENTTLANPTNIVAGQSGVIYIIQGSTPRTMAYGSYWDFIGGAAPSLTSVAGARDALFYHVVASDHILANLLPNWS